jgi:hypothetical protein
MGDLRSQINSLSAAEKAELLDTVWESLEADALSLRTRNEWNLITESPGMSRTHPMSSLASNSGRACLGNRHAPYRLDTGGIPSASDLSLAASLWALRNCYTT